MTTVRSTCSSGPPILAPDQTPSSLSRRRRSWGRRLKTSSSTHPTPISPRSTKVPTPRVRHTSRGQRSCAARMLSAEAGEKIASDQIRLADRQAWAPDGRSVTLAEVAMNAFHEEDQEQIMGIGSYVSPPPPPPPPAPL